MTSRRQLNAQDELGHLCLSGAGATGGGQLGQGDRPTVALLKA